MISSCKTKFITPELTRNFTAQEITDLEKMVDFFKIEFCESSFTSFENCFENFAPNWIEKGLDYSADEINFSDQKKLYSSIDQQTFDEIWNFCMTYQIRPIEREYLDVCANTEGKYVSFLSDVGKSNPFVQKYFEDIISSGDFNQSEFTISHIWNKRNEFDLNNSNYQVIIAVHILTMNDQFQRNRTKTVE